MQVDVSRVELGGDEGIAGEVFELEDDVGFYQAVDVVEIGRVEKRRAVLEPCLLYTSDAADE